ncbi:thiamine diphosphokinase [Candidatus Neomarinimicrobiota bacterium]
MNLAAPVVILAAGEFPLHNRPLKALRDAGCIIACDGAADNLLEHDLEPDWIVGDLDSVSSTTRERFPARLVELANQDNYDLEKAIVWAAVQGAQSVSLVGATGLRDDHALANQLLLFTDFGIALELLTDSGRYGVIRGYTEIPAFSGQPVSLFAESTSVLITTTGLAYDLSNQTLEAHHGGISNQALGELFSIRADGGAVLVFQAYAAGSSLA